MRYLYAAAVLLLLCLGGCISRVDDDAPVADAGTEAAAMEAAVEVAPETAVLNDCVWPSPPPGIPQVTVCQDHMTAICSLVTPSGQAVVGRTDCYLQGYRCVFPCG